MTLSTYQYQALYWMSVHTCVRKHVECSYCHRNALVVWIELVALEKVKNHKG